MLLVLVLGMGYVYVIGGVSDDFGTSSVMTGINE